MASAKRLCCWVDIIRGQIFRTDPNSRATTTIDYPEMVGAAAPREAGGLVAAVASGFVGIDDAGTVTRRVACLSPGTRMNDAKVDPAGRYWAGSCAMDFAPGRGGLWMLDENWDATLVVPGLTQPNGLGWSPDGRFLYLVETQARTILRFGFDPESSTITSEPETLTAPGTFANYPDGLAVDARGHLWVAEFAGSAVLELDADGTLLQSITVPTEQPTSCAFVGPGLDQLWVTSAAAGLDPAADPLAGSIFLIEGHGTGGLPVLNFQGISVPITLRSSTLEVVIAPERGADITSLTDLATGVQTLAVSPTGAVTSGPGQFSDSMVNWTNGYPGGWQLMVPNAGPARIHDGIEQGYHGEASLARWRILAQTESSAELTTELFTAPLTLVRSIVLDGAAMIVTDTITNNSPDPCSFRLGQHPAFGTPFLDGDSFLTVNAATFMSDAANPGTLASPDVCGRPGEVLPAGPVANSLALPAPGSGESLFGALTDFTDPAAGATFYSPTHGFGIQLGWDRAVYPNAWLWMEANSGGGWPWFKRLYSMAVEPVNVIPGEGTSASGHARGGDGVSVAAGETLASVITVSRVPLP